jgi:ABC-type glycerol-3-phosphate transport system substrate-binding protein
VAGCWSDPIQGPAFVRIAEGFNKVQSAIHVKGIRGGAATQILTQVSAGNPPDVYWPSSCASFCTFHWGNLMAASVLFILPIVVLFVATQRTFIQGISMTGLKG